MVKRLDIALVERELAKSRAQAQALIEKGQIFIDGKPAGKPAQRVTEDCILQVYGEKLRYVSRGGLKLEKAVQVFNLSLQDKVCADIGASTGGFTDCMLQNGAPKVYAIDVGHDQLDARLQKDSRVVNLERQNIRDMEPSILPESVDFAAIDVSFISLKLILPRIVDLLNAEGELVALIKPQFEAGKNGIGKHGIVKSQAVHKRILIEMVHYFNEIISVKAIDFSPISGGDGNIEYLLYATRQALQQQPVEPENVVQGAFAQLKGGM